MLTNEQMIAGRFARYAAARAKIRKIVEALRAGRRVQLTTHLRSVVYDARHADMFKATRTGAYVQRGKSWDCIDYCGIRIERAAA